MAIRGRYQAPSVRHRARAGGVVIGGVEIISPRVKIHADSIFAGTLNADLIKAGTISAGLIKSGTIGTVRIPNISANKITAGTILTGRVIIGSPCRIYLDAVSKVIKIYDSVGSLRVLLGSLP